MKKGLLFTLFFAAFLTSCSNVKEPVFEEVEKFKVGKVSLLETSLSADLRFNNPNTFGLKLKKIDCDLYIDSSLLGHFSNSEMVKIPASGTFILPVSGQAKTFTLMEQSAKAWSGRSAFVRIKGMARVGRAGFFKNIPLDYSDTLNLDFLKKNGN